MPDQVLYEQIAAFFSERLNLTVSSPVEDLFETGILDSMAFVDLVMYLEQQFDIRISPHELEPYNFQSVAKIADFVKARGMYPNANRKTAVAEG